MGRYTGPKERLSRREGIELGLKGERLAAGKSGLERRPSPPGQHGARRLRPTVYGDQLRAKQACKRLYGLRERQFRRVIAEAQRVRGVTGEQLLVLLERRLDNVLHRLGLAATRAQARQYVVHGHVLVDGRRLDVPSALVRPGQVVRIRPEKVGAGARAAVDATSFVPVWLQLDPEHLAGTVLRMPVRAEIEVPIDEALVVEFYSRI